MADLPIFPPELPNPLRDGYSFTYGDGRQRLGNDAGPPTWSKRFSSTFHPITFQHQLDALKMGILERFWHTDTEQGNLEFLIRNHTADGYIWADEDGTPLTYEDGTPTAFDEMVVAKFDTPLKITPVHQYWIVSTSVVVLP